ncbi:hypothetical protein [Pseudomonas fluorescens]|nr:hypothetical protein [Pseudomonas fluorescens]
MLIVHCLFLLLHARICSGQTKEPVGAGLPAIAVCQSHKCWLISPHRWQASSHRVSSVLAGIY